MSEENIFDQGTPPDQESSTPPQAPTFSIPTEASDFVGEGKKYNSVEEALKSVPHAQKHIQTLESELANLKEELTKRKTTEELLEAMKSSNQSEFTPPSVEIDENKLVAIVNQSLEAKEKQKIAQQNAASVVDKFTEKFGDKAEEAFITLAKESGMTVQQLNTLATTSPKVVLKLAGLTASNSAPPTPSSGSVNTQALGTKPAEVSAKVPKGATTKDLVSAWKAAGEKVKQSLNN